MSLLLSAAGKKQGAGAGIPGDYNNRWTLNSEDLVWADNAPVKNTGTYGDSMEADNMNATNEIAGPMDGALNFNGADEMLNFNNAALMSPDTNDFTLSHWFRIDLVITVTGGNYRFMSKGITSAATPSNSGFMTGIYYNGSVTKLRFIVGDGALQVTDFEWTQDTGWHHLAGTREGAVTKIYLDGVLKNTLTDSYTKNVTTNLFFSCGALTRKPESEATNDAGYLVGDLDDLMYYERALSGSEILGIYNAGTP